MPEFSYEKSIQRLEEIISRLEQGDIELEEAVNLFDEGTKLAVSCRKSLEEAKQKITLLKNAGSAESN